MASIVRATIAVSCYVDDLNLTDTVKVRWSRDNRVQSKILTREALRFVTRMGGGPYTEWEAEVVDSDIQ